MKKINKMSLCLFMLLGTVFLLISGCTDKDTGAAAPVNEVNGQVEPGNTTTDPTTTLGSQSETPQKPSQPPHDFSDFRGPGAEFKGGNAVTDYNITMVRRVNHPEFFRLVFEFTGTKADTGEAPPEYTVRMENEKLITMRLRGVVKAEAMEDKSYILALSELLEDVTYTRDSNGEYIVKLYFKSPVVFQVFDLAKPARVVVVLRADPGQMNKM